MGMREERREEGERVGGREKGREGEGEEVTRRGGRSERHDTRLQK